MEGLNTVETPRGPTRMPDHMAIQAYIRRANRLRSEAMSALLAAFWQRSQQGLGALVAAIAGRVRGGRRLPSLPIAHH